MFVGTSVTQMPQVMTFPCQQISNNQFGVTNGILNYTKVLRSLSFRRCQKGLCFVLFVWSTLDIFKSHCSCSMIKRGKDVGGSKESEWVRNYLSAKCPVTLQSPYLPHLTADLWIAPRSGKAISPTERQEMISLEPSGCASLCFLQGACLPIALWTALQGLKDPSTPKGDHLL